MKRIPRVPPFVVLAVVALVSRSPIGAAGSIEADLEELIQEHTIPGLAASIIVDDRVAWKGAFGWADVESRRPMTTSTVLNVGSVSKLVTATAVARLWEEGRIDLDADVNRYLPFEVRHPADRDARITVRQLLTHSAGIADSESYAASYACGDPAVSLGDWLRAYLVPGGAFYSDGSFLTTPPGSAFEYSNVGYGLLGLVVGQVSGKDFAEFTAEAIFDPLGMARTGWRLEGVQRVLHATPYWLAAEGAEPDVEEAALLPAGPFPTGELVPFCLYSFYNYPDGLLRTSLDDLARFVIATQPGGSPDAKLLSPRTRAEVFRDQLGGLRSDGRLQGLGWRRTRTDLLGEVWGHGGADPGIRAHVLHRPEDGVTVVVMTNRLIARELRPALERLFVEGRRLSESLSLESRSPE